MRCCASLLFILCSGLATLAIEKPTLEQIFPAGAKRGSTNEVTLLGKFEPWPPKLWSSNAGLQFEFSTNKGKAHLIVSPEASPGPCLIRAFNEEGPSDLRIFVVGDAPETQETEPNNHYGRAQSLTNLPITVNGRLEKNGDVDSFAIPLKTGQWLDASLDCYTLLAKLDAVLRLVTTNGYQLGWNHDFASFDPRLIWQAPYDLTAVLQVFGFAYPADSDIRLSGGAADVYRLHIAVSSAPPADLVELPNEKEPNDKTNSAPAVALSSEIAGTICPPGDVDRFQVSLKKNEEIEARVLAATLGSPLDAWLAIENVEGKELVRNDDADNSRDPRLEWKAPEDGTYLLAIGSITHQGTTECRYHLRVQSLAPDYRVTSTADALKLTAGTTNTLKLNFKRLRGFTNQLSATVKGLPDSAHADSIELPSSNGDISIPVVASTNAASFNGPFRVIISDKTTHQERTAPFELVSRTENNGVPGGYSKLLVESTGEIWLTIKAPEPVAEKK
jgi:hypothetical protein